MKQLTVGFIGNKSCSMSGCKKKHRAKGFCHNHYEIFRRNGHIPSNLTPKQKLGDKCFIDGCEKKPHAKNYCCSHYSKIKRWGQIDCPNDRRGKSLGSKKSLTYRIPTGNIPWNKDVHFEQVRGENHWNWQGGKTQEQIKIRTSLEYRMWRRQVFERDNYTCIQCGDKTGGNLEADHIKPFSKYPSLRFEISNGRTLCHSCHQKTETYGRKAIYA